MPSTTGLSEEKAELEAVFASVIFNRAPGLAHMLRYVCTNYFEGQSDNVKEYNIAVEALGRPADFDQKRDSIVRVEAHRLRKRLSEYYEGEGANHRIRIVLPSGQYVPQFLAAEPPQPPATELIALTPEVLPEPVVLESTLVARRSPRFRVAYLVLAGLIAAAGLTYFEMRSPLRPAVAAARSNVVPEGDEIRILAGATQGPFTDQLGRVWQPDRYFTGGSVTSV